MVTDAVSWSDDYVGASVAFRDHRDDLTRSAAGMAGESSLRLLGGFTFSVCGDVLLGISTGSQRLLAFLALGAGVRTLDQVAATLWPESQDERAGVSLWSALSRLGPARQAVTVTTEGIGLAEGVAVDVHRSRALAHRLIDRGVPHSDDIGAGAVSSLSKDLLPGWYDDWAVTAAEDWRQLRLQALGAAGTRLTDTDRLAEAAVAAVAATQAEPLRED